MREKEKFHILKRKEDEIIIVFEIMKKSGK